MIRLYGIPNCDSVKKARAWLDGKGLDHTFHDYKSDGAPATLIERWADEAGWRPLLNRRSTTYRDLPGDAKADIDRPRAIALMLQHPTLIKRPVAETDDGARVMVGFNESEWENAFC